MNILYETKKYIRSLPKYLMGSGAAFSADLITYTLLRPYLYISISLSISFLVGTCTLYFVLRRTTSPRIMKKRVGLPLQMGIGLGSFLINYLVLIQLERFFIATSMQPSMLSALFIAASTKFIAACAGFIWSSYLTMKLNFSSR